MYFDQVKLGISAFEFLVRFLQQFIMASESAARRSLLDVLGVREVITFAPYLIRQGKHASHIICLHGQSISLTHRGGIFCPKINYVWVS
jgi:hypothetical protein